MVPLALWIGREGMLHQILTVTRDLAHFTYHSEKMQEHTQTVLREMNEIQMKVLNVSHITTGYIFV